MIDMASATPKMRTVKVTNRGQFVIPEEMRRDLDIKGDSILVIVEDGDRLILRREQDVLREDFWKETSKRASATGSENED